VTNTGTCIDAAGNVADSVTVSNINIDKTPPVVALTLPKNGKYSLNESVTATWSATDALSGVVEESKDPKTIKINTTSKGKKKITLPPGLVKDEAGNSSEEVTISYEVVDGDTTKPVITGSRAPLPNALGWNNTDVTVSFSCEDVRPVQSGIETNTVAGKIVTTEGKNQSVTNTGTCIDAAGNVADSVTVSNINIDKTPPKVTITLPGTSEYVLNQPVTATWSATDALSGVVSPASGTVSIDTSSVGTKTFTLPAGTAKDKAGNSSLKVTKSYTIIANTEEPVMWTGLGMHIYPSWLSYVDTMIANGFTELAMGSADYENAGYLADCKTVIPQIIAKGATVTWGITTTATLTAANWGAFRTAVLAGAEWAQNNGVFEFKIGNEFEFNMTLTQSQLIANLKALATEVQAIFTNGNVAYSCGQNQNIIDAWVSAGRGDIDIIASNVYKGGSWDGGSDPYDLSYQNRIDALMTFGSEHTYLTEFNVSYSNLEDYSEDEAVQAAAVTEMINYIKASGMTRAIWYAWKDDGDAHFGVVKNDGTYRLLWSQALLNSESVKFATVPTKTTTASLPGTIALLPRITK
jgi:hypothetical protein